MRACSSVGVRLIAKGTSIHFVVSYLGSAAMS